MLLTNEEIKQQTRQLWADCFKDDEEFLDIYFSEKFDADTNLTVRHDGAVVAAMQLLPYRMTFYGATLHTGYVSGLCVSPQHRGKGMAGRLLREAHRRLYERGGVLSFLIPGSEELRRFYERPEHGAYWTTTFRREVELTDDGADDERVEVTEPDEWGKDLFVYYHRYSAADFMLHPNESDFFAVIEDADRQGGCTLVARRHNHIAGICTAVREADGRVFLRNVLYADATVRDLLARRVKDVMGTDRVFTRIPVPGTAKDAVPYAMARAVNVQQLLSVVARLHPDFELHIGIDGDLDVPENNGYYLVRDGRVTLTEERPGSIVTPGGLAAMLIAAQPTIVTMMLDE